MSPPHVTPIKIAGELRHEMASLSFGPPVAAVYNPLDYAWAAHADYLHKYCSSPRQVLLMGMNPGPWGMAQTGVPFGDVTIVRDWLKVEGAITSPSPMHPKRPILGWDCARSEVSGARLWGWAKARYSTPDRFFSKYFVYNYCPLCFMEDGGKNFTPDKLRRSEQAPLMAACDTALQQLVAFLQPEYCIGVGAFAEQRLKTALPDFKGCIARVPHPSPASPSANKDWAGGMEAALQTCGLQL